MFFATLPALRSRAVYAPFTPSLRVLDRNLERFLQQAFDAPAAAAQRAPEAASGTDAGNATAQDSKSHELSLDMPGVAKDQIDIQIEANQVRIQTKPEAARHHSMAYEFAGEIDAAASQAKLENGVLVLTLAKVAPETKAQVLTVN